MSGTHRPISAAFARQRFVRRLAIPAIVATAAALLVVSQPASAGIVTTVPMGTAGQFSVLAGSTVTNVPGSATRLHQDLGLYAGSAVTGFTAANMVAPAAQHITDSVAQVAKDDLTIAYTNAFNRSAEFTVAVELGGSILLPGVYQSIGQGALGLTGALTLDAGGNQDAVFIFKSGSTLTTAAASSVLLINGAKECNVFWQVSSSATLGTSSSFVGTILALTDINVGNSVTVAGRALARNGQVTLDNDTFNAPLCPATVPSSTTTTAAGSVTTVAGSVTTVAGSDTTVAGSDTTIAGSGAGASPGATVTPTLPAFGDTNITLPRTGDTDITLPRTGGRDVSSTSMFGGFVLALGAGAIVLSRRRRPAA